MAFDLPALSILVAFLVCSILIYVPRRGRYRLPPGPNGLPLLGSVFDAPKTYEWLVYQDWSRQYGACFRKHCLRISDDVCLGSDIIPYEVLGTHYIVLNSAKTVTDLMERRSNIYSDK